VVSGTAPADPHRVRAAVCLIRYQSAVRRHPPAAPPPGQARRAAAAADEAAVLATFEKKAAEIMRRFSKKGEVKDGEN
jgi:hypothetical protein